MIPINYNIITKIHLKIQYTLNSFLKSDLKLEKELPKYKITEKKSHQKIYLTPWTNMTILYTSINLSLKVKQYTRKIFALKVTSKCYFFLIYKEKWTETISRTIHRRWNANDQWAQNMFSFTNKKDIWDKNKLQSFLI